MANYINGKPMKEWIREQQEKNGVLVIHRGTSYDGWNKSTYSETTVTLGGNRDVCYQNADITLRLHGKEYRMKGDRVEFKNGRWYVDGVAQDIPTDAADTMKEANDRLQADLTDRLNGLFGGRLNVNGSVGNTYIHGKGSTVVKTQISGGGGSKGGRRVVMKNGGTVNIHRGGRTYSISGKNIEQRGGRWYADGKPVDWDDIGGEYEDGNVVRIEVNGDVEHLSTVSGDVTVNGSCQDVITASGDVRADLINGSVSTASGDIRADVIGGSASTISGDVYKG